jgi:hypothetical protein
VPSSATLEILAGGDVEQPRKQIHKQWWPHLKAAKAQSAYTFLSSSILVGIDEAILTVAK